MDELQGDIRREFYSKTLETYNHRNAVARYQSFLFPERTKPIREGLQAFLSRMPPGARILDVGSGTGKDVGAMRARGFRAEGVDASMEMVRLATDTYGPYFRQANLLDLEPGDDESFDGITCIATLQHLLRDDLTRGVATLASLLQPDGLILIVTKAGTGVAWDDRLGREFLRATTFFSASEVRGAMNGVGLSVVATDEFSLSRSGRQDDWLLFLGERSASSRTRRS